MDALLLTLMITRLVLGLNALSTQLEEILGQQC